MSHSPFRLDGKRILITGASSGIGRAAAIECAKAGASVILTGRNLQRLEDVLNDLPGDSHSLMAADLTVDVEIDNLVSAADGLDGIVLCAGKGMLAPIQFTTTAKAHDILDTNFLSPIELLRRLLKKKRINSGASVVGIASMGGTHFYTIGNAAYGASKAAFASYLKFAARELALKSIRVNSVLPAMIDTPFIHGAAVGDEKHDEIAKTYPLGRYGRPEEVAYSIVYLLSDATAWITGTDLVIDGGRSLV